MRRIGGRFGLIPKTMNKKLFLKRLLFGKLHPYPCELLESNIPSEKPVPVKATDHLSHFKTVFLDARIGD